MPILQKAECPEFPADELKGCGREGRLDSVTLPQGKGLLGDRGSVNLSERSQCSPEGGDGRAGASDPTCRSQALKGLLQASSCVSWGLESWQQQKSIASAPEGFAQPRDEMGKGFVPLPPSLEHCWGTRHFRRPLSTQGGKGKGWERESQTGDPLNPHSPLHLSA